MISKGHQPTLGDMISKGHQSILSNVGPTLNNINRAQQSTLDMNKSDHQSSLDSIINMSQPFCLLLSDNDLQIQQRIFNEIKSEISQQSNSSLKTSVPPGFTSRPLVTNPFDLIEQESSSLLRPHPLSSTDSDDSLCGGDQSRPKQEIIVSCSRRTSSMVGVVLATNDHNNYKCSAVMQKQKQIVLKRINNRFFSGKRFNFSTPSPDDYILDKQRKAF